MSRRADYKTCPLCGANLDPGERCDCETEDMPEERSSQCQEHGRA